MSLEPTMSRHLFHTCFAEMYVRAQLSCLAVPFLKASIAAPAALQASSLMSSQVLQKLASSRMQDKTTVAAHYMHATPQAGAGLKGSPKSWRLLPVALPPTAQASSRPASCPCRLPWR